MPTFDLYATCPEETKGVLAAELKALGATKIREGYKIVAFQAEEEVFYMLHLRLGTASRIRLKIREFAATTPEMLFSQAKRIHWGEIFDVDCGYLVDGMMADRGEEFMSGNQVSKQVRLAIVDSFFKH